MRHLLYTILILVFATATFSQTLVPGATDTDFVDAVEEWLEGDELEALRDLSALAHDGHVPAKILISRIADTHQFSAHIIERMSRKERIALFREPVGLSGRDWLASASQESELARALWAPRSYAPPDHPDYEAMIPTLVSYGEAKLVLRYLLMSWIYGGEDVVFRALLEEDALFGAAGRHFLAMAIRSMITRGKETLLPAGIGKTEKARAFRTGLTADIDEFALNGQYPLASTRIALPTRQDGVEALAQAVETLPELQPLRLFCETTCNTSQRQTCLADTVWAVAHSGAFPFPFSSPAQSLIPDEQYWGSTRFFNDIKRTLDRRGWQGCR